MESTSSSTTSTSSSPIFGAIKQIFSTNVKQSAVQIKTSDAIKCVPKKQPIINSSNHKQADNVRRFGKIKNNSMVTLDLHNNHVTYHDHELNDWINSTALC